MNENLNLVEILKDCPKGTKLYSTIFGEVELDKVESRATYPISIRINDVDGDRREIFTSEGKLFMDYAGECLLFPSREERNWYNFKPKQPKFDPKTLKPFDRVLVRDSGAYSWICTFYSHTKECSSLFRYATNNSAYEFCIPYNEETKHLVGTNEEAPEYYRYWEN